MTKINQDLRAFHAWDILVKQAKKREVITYEHLGLTLGIHYRVARFVLEKIQSYCKESKIPGLTVLVVNKQTGEPGQGFDAYDADNIYPGREEVYHYNWKGVPNPFSFAADGTNVNDLVKSLIKTPSESALIYRKIQDRGPFQTIFRNALLKAYRGQCAMTGISLELSLDAAHIVPWVAANDSQKLDPQNGILLFSFHHRLFDNGLITINDDYSIICKPELLKRRTSCELEKLMIADLDGNNISVPRARNLRPNPDYIRWRNSKLGWMQ